MVAAFQLDVRTLTGVLGNILGNTSSLNHPVPTPMVVLNIAFRL